MPNSIRCPVTVAVEDVHYKRSRFATRLFADRLYTPAHYWLKRREDDLWQVGFTKFAVRMLGEIVEIEFEVAQGSRIETGQAVGWVESFKAVSDLYAPISGSFEGPNPDLDRQIALIHRDPHDRGWLYTVRGSPGKECVDMNGYAAVLDATIDKMLGKRHEE